MSTHGGKREGAGRKLGSVNKASAHARDEAAKTGELPHQFLLRVARGEEIDGYAPTFNERVDAARAAAPYFAARLGSMNVNANINTPFKNVRELTDAELMHIASGGKLEDIGLTYDPVVINVLPVQAAPRDE